LKRLAHFALLLIAVVIAASYFGVDVLAISAALGLSGFALALAAKDTITNIISGFVLMVSQPFKVGDRIDVASLGSWGECVEIGIRSTNVLMRDNRLVIVPNSAIVDNTVVNYSRPDTTYRLQTDIGIGYGVDIPQISQMIKDTVAKVDGVLPDKNIDVWFTEFGDSSNTFRVRWWVNSYAKKRRSTHDVNTAIQQLSEQLPIDMPNPTFTLDNKISFADVELEGVARALKA
jgi:small-conductance mechanosensitive channel